MAAEDDRDEGDIPSWKYTIYLVAFPDVVEYSEEPTLSDMIHHLVPEARVLSCPIFQSNTTGFSQDFNVRGRPGWIQAQGGYDDGTKAQAPLVGEEMEAVADTASTASTVTDPVSPVSIGKEALNLLDTIQGKAPTMGNARRMKIVLAGYGFGGMVVKQAVIIANTTPKYYDVAFNISNLVFFATPHHSGNLQAWEGVLLRMISASNKSYHGRPSQILSRLVDDVSQLSHLFFRLLSKYPVTNFIEGKGISGDEPVVGKLGKFNNGLEEVFEWGESTFADLLLYNYSDLERMESLRNQFAPPHLWDQVFADSLDGEPQESLRDIYFEALQVLSPSRWILYETSTLDRQIDLNALREIFGSLVEGLAAEIAPRNASVQVYGPPGYGKSALVKLISQDIRQTSSVVIIDTSLSSSESQPTLYSVHVSFVHQIVSQRPSLLAPIRNFLSEILRHETWALESIRVLLGAILHHCQGVKFLIVIYDYEKWPSIIQSWWSETLPRLLQYSESQVTFLTSSEKVIEDFSPLGRYQFNIEKKYRQYKDNFISARLHSLLDRGYGSVILRQTLSDSVRKRITTETRSFEGSFAAINTYMIRLFEGITLTSLNAINAQIDSSKKTEDELYDLEVKKLFLNENEITNWIGSAVSWLLWSARPLRIEELAAATAVQLDYTSLAELHNMISMDMEGDLRRHLGPFVTIENRYGRIGSSTASQILSSDKIRKSLKLSDHGSLTRLCLHYLELVLSNEPRAYENRQLDLQMESMKEQAEVRDMEAEARDWPDGATKFLAKEPDVWTRCLSQVSWKHQRLARDPPLEFLDYACRYWPIHFLRVDKPSEELQDTVANFLLAPKIGERWFELYRLCHAESADPLDKGNEDLNPSTQIPQPKTTETEQAGVPGEEAELEADAETPDKLSEAQKSAACIASYIGLVSIIPKLSKTPIPVEEIKTVDARRGYLERTVAFSETRYRYYLDCAISNDDHSLVQRLLASDREGTTKHFPLHTAALKGSLKTVRALFKLLENPAAVDEGKRTPLHMAAMGGSTEVIRFLLGVDVVAGDMTRKDVPNMIDMKDNSNQTPMIIASRMGHAEAIKVLFDLCANITIQDTAGKTALHYAVLHCPAAIEDMRVAYGKAAHLKDGSGRTPLHISARSGSAEVTSILVSALRSSGGSGRLQEVVNAPDNAGRTPLEYAAEGGHTRIVQCLLDTTRFRHEDRNYANAAKLAAANGHLDTVKCLISGGTKKLGDHILLAASKTGQLLVVNFLLEKSYVSTSGFESLETQPLCEAAANGHIEVVRTLLRSNANVNIEDAKRKTPLHHAAENGRFAVARTLLAFEASVHAPDMDRRSPLHSAARAGHVDIIQLLLEGKANIEASSSEKETPIHLAIRHPAAVEALLSANADPNAADLFRRTPLHMAAMQKSCVESARLLLAKDAYMYAKDDDGNQPLYYAICGDDLPMVKLLCKDRKGMGDSPAEKKWAVESGALEVLGHLLSLVPEATDSDHCMHGLLCDAASGTYPKVVSLLLRLGANANSLNSSRRTPLQLAASNGRVEIIEELLKNDVEVDKEDDEGSTALHLAAAQGHLAAVDVLLKSQAAINKQDNQQRTPLYRAAYSRCDRIVDRLLHGGADMTLADNDGWAPLHGGADNLKVTTLLTNHGADVNVVKNDKWTPLHLAISWGHSAVAKFLLDKGANPNLVNGDGNTGLHLAVRNHDIDLLKLVLTHGVEVDRRNKEQITSLQDAIGCSICGPETVSLLLDHGADVTIRTNSGDSCLELAVRKKMSKALAVLLDAKSTSGSGPAWTFEDMTLAYWKAVELTSADLIKIFEKKNNKLLNEVSTKGLTSLETCLSNRGNYGQEEALAVHLVELGADPFSRRLTDGSSGVELGIITRGALKVKFMKACAERVPTDVFSLAAAGIGFKVLRIATELDDPALWNKLQGLRDQTANAKDDDGWTLDLFIHQSMGRVPAEIEGPPARSYRTPTALVVPPLWVPPGTDLDARLRIGEDRLGVCFSRVDSDPIQCIRADFPFQPRPFNLEDMAQVYFEVTIQEPENETETHKEDQGDSNLTIAIGFCGEFVDNRPNTHIGWNVWTAGYHGDDGCVFENTSSGMNETGQTFGTGNTVGCGIDYAMEDYFFTKDGEIVARYKSKVIFRKLYPAVSHRHRACRIKVNFGQDAFLWPSSLRGGSFD